MSTKIVSFYSQEIFNQLLKHSVGALSATIVYVVVYWIMSIPVSRNALIAMIVVYFFAPLLFWLWYHLIGKSVGDQGAYKFSYSGQHLKVSKFGNSEVMDSDKFKDFAISGYIFKVANLCSIDGQVISIDYYAFTNKQRDQIANYLSRLEIANKACQ